MCTWWEGIYIYIYTLALSSWTLYFLRRPFQWQTKRSDCFGPISTGRENSVLCFLSMIYLFTAKTNLYVGVHIYIYVFVAVYMKWEPSGRCPVLTQVCVLEFLFQKKTGFRQHPAFKWERLMARNLARRKYDTEVRRCYLWTHKLNTGGKAPQL